MAIFPLWDIQQSVIGCSWLLNALVTVPFQLVITITLRKTLMVTESLGWAVVGGGGGVAGAFCWGLDGGVGTRFRDIGGRLVYVPTKDSQVYLAAIASWKEKMAA